MAGRLVVHSGPLSLVLQRRLVFENDSSGSGAHIVYSDHLGSSRTKADLFTPTVSTRDGFYPFCQTINVPTDTHDRRFSAKERVWESGLDYFGTRYNSSILGRFTSPDPLRTSAKPTDPQTWNRYAYVYNNPLKYRDPDGRVGLLAAAVLIFEGGSTAYDGYQFHKTLNDPNATTTDKVVDGGAVAVGILAPGAGQMYKKGAEWVGGKVTRLFGRLFGKADEAVAAVRGQTVLGKYPDLS